MKNPILAVSSLILAGSVAAVIALSPDSKNDKTRANSPVVERLDIDRSPPKRDGQLGGYAIVVEKVSPSVVSIVSSRKARLTSNRSGAAGSPFDELFKDPRFAPLFGTPDRGERQPRIVQSFLPLRRRVLTGKVPCRLCQPLNAARRGAWLPGLS